MPKRRGLTVPIFGIPPHTSSPQLDRWLHGFTTGVQRFMRDVVEIGADYDLIAHVTRQTLTAGFTLSPDSHDLEVQSASAVVSDATTAIKDGRNGQTIVITNVGSAGITFKTGANISIFENTTLYGSDTIVLKWSDTLDNWSIIGSGHLTTVNRAFIGAGTVNVGAGEDTLWTWTMPANTLVVNSMIKVSAVFIAAANANAKKVKFHIGGSSFIINNNTPNPNNVNLIVDITLWYNNATDVYGYINAWISNNNIVETNFGIYLGTSINLTTDTVIKFTGEATTTGDINCVWASAIPSRVA